MSIIVEEICTEICKRWPGKYSDPEVLDMAQRLSRFPVDAILGALESHKNTNKFKPAVSELLGRLKGKESGQQQQAPMAKWLSHSEMLAKEIQCTPIEATLRFWRGQWFTYAKQAQRNEATIRQTVLDGPLLDFAIGKWKVQRDGAEKKCIVGCRGGLIECRVRDVEPWVASIFSAPGDFRLAIDELRQNGIETLPEPVGGGLDETEGTIPVFNQEQSVPEFSGAF